MDTVTQPSTVGGVPVCAKVITLPDGVYVTSAGLAAVGNYSNFDLCLGRYCITLHELSYLLIPFHLYLCQSVQIALFQWLSHL